MDRTGRERFDDEGGMQAGGSRDHDEGMASRWRDDDDRTRDPGWPRGEGYGSDYGREAGREYERGYRAWQDRGAPVRREASGGGWSSAPDRMAGRRRPPVEGGFGYTDGGYGGGPRYGTDDGYGGGDYYGGGGWLVEEPGSHAREERGVGFFERVKRFFGKGPKGYKRSDERIRDDVCDRLSEGYLDATDIEVSVKDGEVTLEGTVGQKLFKRMAEDLAEQVRGVFDVHNRIRVKREAVEEPARVPDNGRSTSTRS